MEATPAKWNVFNVICVPGSPILWAHRAPTAVPGSILALEYFSLHRFRKSTSWDLVQRSNQDNTDKKQMNNSIFTVFFFIQVLSTLTLTAIKLRLDEIVLFPHLLTRRPERLLTPHAQVSRYFWKRGCFPVSVLEEIRLHTKRIWFAFDCTYENAKTMAIR